MQIELIKCSDNDLGVNSYVLKQNNFAVVIDPNNFDEICACIGESKLEYIFLTHEHFDHILAVDLLRQKYGALVVAQNLASKNIGSSAKNLSKFSQIIYDFMKKEQRQNVAEITINSADIVFDDEFALNWHENVFKFKHTPGHSDGSCVIMLGDWIFSGDSLFECVDTSIIGGKKAKKAYDEITLPFLASLDKNSRVFAGHYGDFLLGDKFDARQKAIQIYKNRVKIMNFYLDFNAFLALLDEENTKFIVRENCIFILS
ncbi:MAG: MBL fold metallo-hydrolase, partial [Campylobacter sp.]|nr:MBL fold metallo-hydrolase [Campylobacter sp.]